MGAVLATLGLGFLAGFSITGVSIGVAHDDVEWWSKEWAHASSWLGAATAFLLGAIALATDSGIGAAKYLAALCAFLFLVCLGFGLGVAIPGKIFY